MTVTYTGPKLLVALSSKGLGGISTAPTPVVTVNSSALDTARRVAVFSTAGSTSMSLVVTGVIEGGGTKTEVMIGSSSANTTINSVWDYVSLTSVVASSAANIPVWFGTSSMGGTPWKLVDWNKTPQELSGYVTLSTSANSMSGQFDVTLDDPTFITGRNSPVTVPTVFNSTSLVGAQCSTNTLGPSTLTLPASCFRSRLGD
jgi:hypothetical protein